MESASQAPVTFTDVMCQMQDMLNPEVPECFTLRDLRRERRLAGAMFNILFNLGKFVAYETRDPFVVRQERAEEPEATDWDRFARQEYIRLALEEETADDGGQENDQWEQQTDHLLDGVAIGVAHMRDGIEPLEGSADGHLAHGPLSPSFLS
jgi:serine/threonine-protein phosphatase 2A regulatory subunit B''